MKNSSKIGNFTVSTLKNLFILSTSILSFSIPLQFKNSDVLAQNAQAFIYDPPSNVKFTPNGRIQCTIKFTTYITTYGYNNGWYITDVCGETGYIHQSQITFPNSSQNSSSSSQDVDCWVTNIQTGQLAVRSSPGGASIAGLNNNNTVQYIKGDIPWYYIRVIQGPNSQVSGKTGWVNANYLECYWN